MRNGLVDEVHVFASGRNLRYAVVTLVLNIGNLNYGDILT